MPQVPKSFLAAIELLQTHQPAESVLCVITLVRPTPLRLALLICSFWLDGWFFFMWLFKLSRRAQQCSQNGQANGFSPVWTRMCMSSFFFDRNFFSQSVHAWSYLPWCFFSQRLNSFLCLNFLPQVWQQKFASPVCLGRWYLVEMQAMKLSTTDRFWEIYLKTVTLRPTKSHPT